MTVPVITPLPPAPTRNMAPAEFVAAANLWVAAQAQRIDEQNAQATALNALGDSVATAAQTASAAAALAAGSAVSAGVIATSSSSASIDGTTKSFSIQSGKLFAPGMFVLASPAADRSKFMILQVNSYVGTTLDCLAPFITSAGGGGPYTSWDISLAAVPQGLGTYAWWIPVGAITARVTNGAEFGQIETTANKIMLRSLDFDASTIEYGQVQVRMPKSWDLGTIKFSPIWSHASTSTNFKVSWGLRAVAISDNEAADAAMGTAVFSNDTGGVTNRVYAGPQSAAMTVAGSPAAEDWVIFEIFRKADDATNDTLAIDARLHGFTLYVQSNAGSDA